MLNKNQALEDLEKMMPGLLKRAVVTANKIVAWTTNHPDTVFAVWKSYAKCPLRLVPTKPLEGCTTQETWNRLWDNAITYKKGIRILE